MIHFDRAPAVVSAADRLWRNTDPTRTNAKSGDAKTSSTRTSSTPHIFVSAMQNFMPPTKLLGFSHSTQTASWYSFWSAKRPEDLPEAKPNQEQAYSRFLSRAESQSAAVYIATSEPPIPRHRLSSLIAKVSLDEKTIIHHARLQQHRAACGSPGCAGSIRPSHH